METKRQPLEAASRTTACSHRPRAATLPVNYRMVWRVPSFRSLDARQDAQNAANEFRRNDYETAAAEYNALQTKMETLQYTSWGLLGRHSLAVSPPIFGLAKQSVALTPNGIVFSVRW